MRKVWTYAKYAGLGLLVLLVGLIVWGFAEPRFLDQEEITGEIPELPAVWQGKRIVQLSDWQIGLWFDTPGTVEEAIDRTIAVDPELVVLTGDFIYGRDNDPHQQYIFLTQMGDRLREAGIPTYAVLGNHDYRLYHKGGGQVSVARAREVERALESGGVRVLKNEAVKLDPRGESSDEASPFYLVGIDSRLGRRARPGRALAQVPEGAPRLLIMHHPDTFGRLPAHTAPVALAGHTHGGQIRIPGLPEWTWINFSKGDDVHADGWVPDYGAEGNRLYVNRGIGMSVIPMRINCPPEMTVITLRPQRAIEKLKPPAAKTAGRR